MTPTQLRYLRAIDKLTKRRGFPPSIREICRELNMSSANASWQVIDRLIKVGMVTRGPRISRSLVITESGRMALEAAPESCPSPADYDLSGIGSESVHG